MFPALLLASVIFSPVGHVNDFAQMLRPETVSSLETTLSNFEKQTGNEIAVVTIPSLGNDETIETYAEKLFQEWGIGKAKEDNGLLLLISRDDREMRIEVGYGLEPVVTDIESSRVIETILVPAFKQGKYDEGVVSAANKLVQFINVPGSALEDMQNSANELKREMFGRILGQFIYPLILFLIFLTSILARSKSWWLGGVIGGVVGLIFFSFLVTIALILLGLLFDYVVSKTYKKSKNNGVQPPWWIGGGGLGGGRGGGFGGFGGGMSGGGGASGKW